MFVSASAQNIQLSCSRKLCTIDNSLFTLPEHLAWISRKKLKSVLKFLFRFNEISQLRFLKKNGFGWLYRDFFYISEFRILLTDDGIYFYLLCLNYVTFNMETVKRKPNWSEKEALMLVKGERPRGSSLCNWCNIC
jgi:hypothetical protein